MDGIDIVGRTALEEIARRELMQLLCMCVGSLPEYDYRLLRIYADLAGPKRDMSVLSDYAIMRISFLHHKYYKPDE